MRDGCVPEGAAGAGAAGGAGGRAWVTGAAPHTSDPEAARCPLRPAEGHGRGPRAAHGCVTVELCVCPLAQGACRRWSAQWSPGAQISVAGRKGSSCEAPAQVSAAAMRRREQVMAGWRTPDLAKAQKNRT